MHVQWAFPGGYALSKKIRNMSVKKIHLCQQFASSIDEREKSNNCIKWLLQFDLLERGKKKPNLVL